MSTLVCRSPFTELYIGHGNSNTYICCCPDWVEKEFWFTATKDMTAKEIWNNENFVRLRNLWKNNESHDACKRCPVLTNREAWFNQLETINDEYPSVIRLANYTLCNLQCVICRPSFSIPNKIETNEEVLQEFCDHARLLSLLMSGEVFTSQWHVDLLQNIKNKNLAIELWTNGILLPDRWHTINNVHNRIERICISIDAATQATYEKVRFPGKWEHLQAALKFIQNLGIPFTCNFCVTTLNYKEMSLFIDMCASYNADHINFSLLSRHYHSDEEYASLLPYEMEDYQNVLNQVIARNNNRVIINELLRYNIDKNVLDINKVIK